MTSASHEYRQPPGPTAPMPLGIDPETLELLQQMRREFGDMVAMTKPNGRLAYFINDAHEVRRILTRRHAKYRKGPGFERVKMLLGNGLIVSDGDVWRRSRTMIQPAFSRQNVHRLIQVMIQCAERRAASWRRLAREGLPCNITAETSDFALELILICTFGDDYEKHIATAAENPFAFLSNDSARDLSVVMKVRELRRLLTTIIDERRAEDLGNSFDFLAMYLKARDKQGNAFSTDELLDELMTLIVAGFETSANTLSWAWFLLARHPDVESKLIAEARQFVPAMSDVTVESLANMQYTQQVLEETLRLYPPVWLFTRRAHEFDELDHFDVPPECDIYLSPFVLHRSENYWPKPDDFDPERFTADGKPKKDRPYFPFSLGPRRCLGEYFSFLEMKVHLGLLLPQFRLESHERQHPDLELAINLRSATDIILHPTERD